MATAPPGLTTSNDFEPEVNPMNKQWILSHLREAQAELSDTISRIESESAYGEIEFEIAMTHLYNHVNTAWNSRNVNDGQIGALSEDDFFRWRAFPSDISMGQ